MSTTGEKSAVEALLERVERDQQTLSVNLTDVDKLTAIVRVQQKALQNCKLRFAGVICDCENYRNSKALEGTEKAIAKAEEIAGGDVTGRIRSLDGQPARNEENT